MRRTVEQQIAASPGITTGFDYLRIVLSLAVLLWHAFAVCNFEVATALWGGPWRAVPAIILPMFFALSGYLVAGSLMRVRLHQFALLRVLRIIPALTFETVLTALLLGPAFTVLPLAVYFSSPEFFAYFFNIIGYIHYTLPGVFDGRMLNAQLWTIPSELECYVILMGAAAVGLTGRRHLLAALTIAGAIVATLYAFGGETLNPYAPLGGRVLVFSFLAGVLIFLYRDRIPYRFDLFALSFVTAAVLLTFPKTSYLAGFPIAYATVWLGLARPPKLAFGDLSYGVFLFHFPILQCAYQIGGNDTPWPIYVAIVLPVTMLFACLSWYGIERPILHRKAAIIAAIERQAAWIAARLPIRPWRLLQRTPRKAIQTFSTRP